MREKGVSPVVGTILLIAITIALVGVVLAIVSGLGSRGTPLLARIRIVDVGQDGIVLAHDGGDELIAEKTLVKVEINGNVTEEVLSNLGTGGTFEVGDQVTISGVNYSRGDEVKVTIIDQDSKTKIFEGSAYVTDAIAKKRPITIYGSSSDLTGYQVEVVVDYDSDMQSDFDDLRFKDSDEVTELPYWIENHNLGENAIVWVRVPHIPASDNHTIWMYYGDPNANSGSNGNTTFEFFDDFEEHAENDMPDGWIISSGCVDVRVVDDKGNKVLSDGTGSGCGGANCFGEVVAGDTSWTDVAVRQRFRSVDDVVYHAGVIVRYTDENNEVYGGIVGDNIAEIWNRIGGSWTQIGGPWTIPDVGTSWHVQELRMEGDNVDLYIDSNYIGSGVLSTGAPTNGKSGFWCQYSQHGYRDDHMVRKYISPEPSASIGNETLA